MLALTLAATACGGSQGATGPDLYAESCAICHGDRAEGGIGPAIGPGSNSVDLTDDQLAGVITVGPGSMPGFPRLSDEQINSLVAYMRELQKP